MSAADYIVSNHIRQLERTVTITHPQTAINGEILMGGGATQTACKVFVLQQWWHEKHACHNSSTGLNGEWRDVPIIKGQP